KCFSECVFLFAAGIHGAETSLYHRVGDDVVLHGDDAALPCDGPAASRCCSTLSWFYSRQRQSDVQAEVKKGEVSQRSPRAARLSLSRNCSLIINNITAEDAGSYSCWLEGNVHEDFVHLSILTSEYFYLRTLRHRRLRPPH
uniref:Ig-like domain-containing protein n=1 Tax=Kryptolebias marmoratus TaxID=37003 RepID=A0A3Q2ZUV8_KRYMA